ncbi:hypothetical protein [Streptomyces sp. NPDC051636]|uniref:hypothetical protein n=1 Tax=Streptomyces sp. NPDC051636 TaxID=3365663 RepID=UPI0037B03327
MAIAAASPEAQIARATAVLHRYLTLGTGPAEQDPVVRGLAAARWYATDTGTRLGVPPLHGTEEAEAESVLTLLFADVLLYADTRQLDPNELWQRLWALYRNFDPLLPPAASLAEADREAVREVVARLLADLLLCSDRLGLESQEIANQRPHRVPERRRSGVTLRVNPVGPDRPARGGVRRARAGPQAQSGPAVTSRSSYQPRRSVLARAKPPALLHHQRRGHIRSPAGSAHQCTAPDTTG